MSEDVMNDESIAAMFAFAVLQSEGSEIRIPYVDVALGLPPNATLRVRMDEKNEEIVIDVADVDSGQ